MKFNIKNISLLSIVFFILLYFRRGNQLVNPNVWNEDGAFNIISFLKHGWLNLLEPVQGYLITISKLITNISMSISFIYYPEVSTYITWIFIIFVAILIVYAPTKLAYPLYAALMVFLIPTNAEVYGLPLYAFWFSTLFLFLVALWEPHKKQVLKNILLIIGGVSSPTIVLMVPIQMFRAFFFKNKKEEIITLLFAIIISVIQLSFIVKTGAKTNIPHIDMAFIEIIISKFFGLYYLGGFGLSNNIVLFGGVYLLILMITYTIQNRNDKYIYILLFMLIATIGLSSARVDPRIFQPMIGGGARYFFFPYIMLSWTLLYMIKNSKVYEVFVVPILLIAIIVALQHFCRIHDDLEWKNKINQCQDANGSYVIPVHYDGNKNHAWHIYIDGKVCRERIKMDYFELPNNLKGNK